MALSCGAKCAKLLLLIFNAIFWSSGIIFFSLGIFFLVEDERSLLFGLFANQTTSYALPQYLAWASIAIGSAIFIIGFCGCCGALKDLRFLLILFMAFLFIIFALELTVGVLAVVFQEKVVAELKLKLTDKLQKQYGYNDALTAAIDLAQTKYECCGIGGPEDYRLSVWRNQSVGGQGNTLVKTCCTLINMKEKHSYINPRPIDYEKCKSNFPDTYRHNKGCESALEAFIRTECLVFIIIGCGFSGITLFGMIISLCLCRALGSTSSLSDREDT
ncbi:CD151 antigen-like [Panonychus citri]|uniref:CD151 antigen-like n=1 Tax=Panonychus citri TaxID=50023 RepID=UPI00230821EF|nr:CD151 antigen-like [Panonychus citri]